MRDNGDVRIRWRDFEFPNRVILDPETKSDTYGKFTAEPFERGFGSTIGNSLRRILISSIEGVGVKNVRIDGVEHELTTVPGVKEDVPEIISNIKQIVLDLDKNQDQRTLHIDVSQQGIVKAGHIQPDPAVEIVNPDLHIATLAEDTEFKVEMDVERGRGYVNREKRSDQNGEIGNIPVDSLFSPIRRVRYDVEDTRVGERTDFDRLILEIWTDGSITPEQALIEASKILRKHLNPFVKYFEVEQRLLQESRKKAQAWKEQKQKSDLKEILQRDIEELDVHQRTINALKDDGYKTIEDVASDDEDTLLEVRNFGGTSLEEVKNALEVLGLEVDMDLSEVYGGKQPFFEAQQEAEEEETAAAGEEEE